MALLADAVTWDAETRSAVLDAVLHEFRHLVALGHFAPVRKIFEAVTLIDDERVRLIDALDQVLEYDFGEEFTTAGPGLTDAIAVDESDGGAGAGGDVDHATRQGVHQVAAWREAFSGPDLYSRVLALAGKERWRSVRLRHENEWKANLESLAGDLAQDPEALARALPWLTSPAAKAGAELGEALGMIDSDGVLFDLIMGTAAPGDAGLLARGYAKGLASSHANHINRLEAWLDARETDEPVVAADVSISAGEAAKPLARVLSLFDRGHLPSYYLYARNFPTDKSGEFTPADLELLLERLAVAAEAGDQVALRVGLDNLSFRLPHEPLSTPDVMLTAHPRLQALGWRLLEAVVEGTLPPSHWWDSLLVHLGRFDAVRASRYCAGLLGSLSIAHEDALIRAISKLAGTHPHDIMSAVGNVMLGDSVGYRFFIGDYKALFDAIPDEVKLEWLERVGVEGARRIARHLASPYVTEDGRAVVPPFTAWVLERFQDDERTMNEFSAGTHSWKIYRGDIAAEHEAEAEVARRFLDHPLVRVREWAAQEERIATAEAREARRRAAEQDLY